MLKLRATMFQYKAIPAWSDFDNVEMDRAANDGDDLTYLSNEEPLPDGTAEIWIVRGHLRAGGTVLWGAFDHREGADAFYIACVCAVVDANVGKRGLHRAHSDELLGVWCKVHYAGEAAREPACWVCGLVEDQHPATLANYSVCRAFVATQPSAQ